MKIPTLKTKDLLTVSDLSRDEIIALFKFTAKLKSDLKKGKHRDYLKKKSLAMIFEKSSTRTRVSFETGVTQLGGHALFLSGAEIQIGRGETISDTAKVLSRYVDCIMIRTFAHSTVVELAEKSDIPVINGLSDTFHPCQALTDFFTIYERDNDLSKSKLTYIGDGNNMANSLIMTAAVLGLNISVAAPRKYTPELEVIENAMKIASATGARIEITPDLDLAVKDANYIYTDVWVSMGQEKEAAEKIAELKDYKITKELLNKCAPGCLVLHCLPAHRGEEIDADVIDSDRSIVFDQAENRLHVQKAIMCALMK